MGYDRVVDEISHAFRKQAKMRPLTWLYTQEDRSADINRWHSQLHDLVQALQVKRPSCRPALFMLLICQ